MKNLIAITAASFAFATFAAPVVSDVTLSQNGGTVTINYTLAKEPGIVTVDVQTNAGDNVWVSIGGEHLTYFAGDANRKVEPGARTITWKPRKAWPDNEVTENVKAVVSAWSLSAPPDYMVVSLTAANVVNYYTCAENVPLGVSNDLYKTEYLVMRKIPAANVQWRMGSPTTENGRMESCETPHVITLSRDYYIGVYPVTQRQYELLMNARFSYFYRDEDYATRPMEQISYEDLRGEAGSGFDWPKDGHAVKTDGFIDKLRKHSGLDGFDLPTEAQWEFACRAGHGAALYDGQDLEDTVMSSRLNALARYANNGGRPNGEEPASNCTAENGTAKVGSYKPNDWGVYDMLGNVLEWCLDWYQESPLGFDVEKGPVSGDNRVTRGGCWNDAALCCRNAFRRNDTPSAHYKDIGFRLACSAEVQ